MADRALPELPNPVLTFSRNGGDGVYSADQLRAYALAAVEAERERCAKICEPSNMDDPSDWTEYAKVRAECAAAIRASSKAEGGNAP